MPKVSVIVPVYNVEKYINKCLESLEKQTLQDIEIIIVNDGSTDNSIDIINNYMQKYPKKFICVEKENGGLSDARNFGMKYASGEYIAFLDSDDYAEKDTYQKMYELAKRDKSDMVECDFYWEYPNKLKEDIGAIYNGKHEMIEKVRVVAWNKLIKREVIEKNNIHFPKDFRYEDVEFTYKLIPCINKVSFLKKPLIHYVQRNNSIINLQNKRTREIFDVLEHVLDFYKDQKIYEVYKEELEYIYTRYLLCSSLLRMVKIDDKKTRRENLDKTWENLNTKFPNWKENKILRKRRTLKNLYMRSINKLTYKIYCTILRGI